MSTIKSMQNDLKAIDERIAMHKAVYALQVEVLEEHVKKMKNKWGIEISLDKA